MAAGLAFRLVEAAPQAGGAQEAADDEIKKLLDGSSGDAAPVAQRQSDPEALAVIEQYLNAIGGSPILTAIADRTTKFHNIKYSATGETEALIALYLKQGYKYREEWEIKGFSIGDKPLAFVQIYNGDIEEGWVSMFDTVSALEGRTLGVFVWDKYLDDFFVNMGRDGYTVHMAGKGVVDDEPADITRVVDFSGRHIVRYFFSSTSGLLLKKDWVDSTQKEPVKKEQYYKKYTRIKFSDKSERSIMFPLQHEIMVDGDLDTERVYSEVKFNSGLNDALFAKPKGKPFEQRDLIGGGAPDAIIRGLNDGKGPAEGSKGRRRPPVKKKTPAPPKPPE